jgi:hypothetical protein
MEEGNANRLKREIIALKRDNQNLRQQIIELQWQMQQQKLKILTALGESTEMSSSKLTIYILLQSYPFKTREIHVQLTLSKMSNLSKQIDTRT